MLNRSVATETLTIKSRLGAAQIMRLNANPSCLVGVASIRGSTWVSEAPEISSRMPHPASFFRIESTTCYTLDAVPEWVSFIYLRSNSLQGWKTLLLFTLFFSIEKILFHCLFECFDFGIKVEIWNQAITFNHFKKLRNEIQFNLNRNWLSFCIVLEFLKISHISTSHISSCISQLWVSVTMEVFEYWEVWLTSRSERNTEIREIAPFIFLFQWFVEVSREIGCHLEDAPDFSAHEDLAHEVSSVFCEKLFKILFVIAAAFLWQVGYCF